VTAHLANADRGAVERDLRRQIGAHARHHHPGQFVGQRGNGRLEHFLGGLRERRVGRPGQRDGDRARLTRQPQRLDRPADHAGNRHRDHQVGLRAGRRQERSYIAAEGQRADRLRGHAG